MDINLPPHDTSLDYRDMEPGSYLLRRGSSQHQREFMFQMLTDSLQRETTASPADELFYKGNLLPLHLPPRIEMVEKILRDSVTVYEGLGATPLHEKILASTTASTPFELYNVSPCESRSISRELVPKKSWLRNIKLVEQHLFSPKVKGSRAFFKSLIRKSGCSDDSSVVAAKGFVAPSSRRKDASLNGKENTYKGDSFQWVQPNQSPVMSPSEESVLKDSIGFGQRRRWSSLSSRWRHSNKICSSSFSSSFRSSSTSASKERSASWRSSICPYVDTESPIQAAIAYCKQSQSPPGVLEKQPDSEDDLGTE